MNIIKKLILIVIIPLTVIVIATSCSKPAGANKKGKQKAAETATKTGNKLATAAKADGSDSNGKKTLTVARTGQYADLSWHFDSPETKVKLIHVLRSTTGLGSERKVAELAPDATGYRDCLPNADAQWYWVQFQDADKKNQLIGPVRVAPDKAGSANYITPEDAYKVTITRGNDIATLVWEFPEAKYKTIQIIRNKRPVAYPFAGGSTTVVTSLEGKSRYSDALNDPNSEYWYWFRITTQSGTIIQKGPIKADYVRPAAKSSK